MLSSLRLFSTLRDLILLKKLSGSKSFGGMHIKPTTSNFKSYLHKFTKSFNKSIFIPFFWSSSPMLTCIKNLIFFWEFFSISWNLFANFSLSSVWIKLNNENASLALLDWSLPIKWSWIFLFDFRISDHLSLASWTLFSAKSKWPILISYLILSKFWFLVTTNKVVSFFILIISSLIVL